MSDPWAGATSLLGGPVQAAATPLLTTDDLGVMRGDGVFETLLTVDGAPRGFGAHLDRMRGSAALLDLRLPEEALWRRAAGEVLAAAPAGLSEIVLRLVCTRGREHAEAPTAFVRAGPLTETLRRQRRDGVDVVLLDRGRTPSDAPWLLRSAKTLSYAVHAAALREAHRRGAEDVVFTDPDGRLLEAPTASVVVVGPGRTMRTPPVDAGILPGTTAAALLDAARVAGWSTAAEPLAPADLTAADAVWLVSSVRLAVAVRRVDGVSLAARVPTDLAFDLLGLSGLPR